MEKITDPRTTKLVKTIHLLKIFKEPKVSKILVWEYFRNRNNMTIQEVYDKYKDEGLKRVRMTFFNDNTDYDVDI
jgi:hypothetical protein